MPFVLLIVALGLGLTPCEPDGASALVTAPCSVVRVVDGDTLHVLRRGKLERLRLSCVDTEEKLAGRASRSTSKPETVFGEECALWARELFRSHGDGRGETRVRLLFPDGVERRDAYGRLLCHVLLPDGRDYNLLLVLEGKSPYFNKYGDCRGLHREFVRAQEAAMDAEKGIWNSATNRARSPGAPSARRPYARLLPWWEARAAAIRGFRRLHERDPEGWIQAEDGDALQAALERCRAKPEFEVRVFGVVREIFSERDGSHTVLFQSSDRSRSFRARIGPGALRGELARLIAATRGEFRPNHLALRGRLSSGRRGIEMSAGDPEQWHVFGPWPCFSVPP